MIRIGRRNQPWSRDSDGKWRTILLLYLRTSPLLSFHFGLHRNLRKKLLRSRWHFTSSHWNPPNKRHWSYKDYRWPLPKNFDCWTAWKRNLGKRNCVPRRAEFLKHWIAITNMISRVSHSLTIYLPAKSFPKKLLNARKITGFKTISLL